MRVNVAEKMRELLDLFERGNLFRTVDLFGKPECEDEWGDDYAIIEFYYDPQIDVEYFHEDAFLQDLANALEDHFGGKYVYRDNGSFAPNQIVIVHHTGSQELEVYRCL